MLKKTILGAIALNGASAGSNWGLGWCDPFGPETVKDFKVADYMGNWYQITSDKDFSSEGNRDCVTASYKLNADAWWSLWPVEVRNRSYKDGTVSSGENWFGGASANARCTWGNGNCNVKFTWYPEGTYMVLETDYTGYSLVYNCDTWFGLWYTNNAWILARANSINQAYITGLATEFKKKVSNSAYPIDDRMVNTVQGGSCQYGF